MTRKCPMFLTVLVLCYTLLSQATNEGAMASAMANLCSNIEVREVASNFDNGLSGEYKAKRSAMWFGPRMGKRGPHMDAFEEQQGSTIPDDLLTNVQVLLKRELEDRLGADSQWVVYLVNEFPNKYMTPRMGRELGEKCLELHMSRPPFAPRLGRNTYPLQGQFRL